MSRTSNESTISTWIQRNKLLGISDKVTKELNELFNNLERNSLKFGYDQGWEEANQLNG